MPKVSVIIPTYNRAEFLRRAIRSVLNQTYQDFEIVVVDDASTDKSRDVVSGISDERIRYICHEVNKGCPAARNTGVTNSRGEYIAFLDDDDEWLPDKLKMQVDLLDGSPSTTGGVYTASLVIDRPTGMILDGAKPEKKGNLFDELFLQNCIRSPSTVLIRRRCFEKVGRFDTSLGFVDDWDMWIRVSKEFRLEYIKMPLVKYYYHDGQSSADLGYVARSWEALLKKHKEYFLLNRKNCSEHYRHVGNLYCFNGDSRKGKQAFLRATKICPFEIRNYFNFCLSLLGSGNYKTLKEFKEKLVSSLS